MKMNESATRLIHAALDAVDPARAVHNALRREGDVLYVGGQQTEGVPLAAASSSYDLSRYERVWAIGGGKAGAPMVRALGEILGSRLSGGWINVKEGHLAEPQLFGVTVHEAGHPIPNEAGRLGALRILELAQQAGEHDLVFCLISGGGSALLPLPVEGVSLADLQEMTDALLRCGATINEINTVRKHCSRIKGGQLARAAFPATVVSLILSDVVGNPLDVIASGPTVPDTTTFADAHAVLTRYDIVDSVPGRIVAHLVAGMQGDVPETPKPGEAILARVQNIVVGSNTIAAQAAQAAAQQMGFHTLLLSTYIEGEAREVGRVMAGIAKSLAAEDRPIPKPACLIAGGETTVTIRGSGKGGRNQELALAAALSLDGWEGTTLMTLATDGSDGPTDAAGAIVDGQTVSRAREKGLSALDYLARNDSYTFFAELGDLIRTGPTQTNVNDLLFILVR